MDGQLDEGLRIPGDPLALGQRRIDACEALSQSLVAIQAEGLVDGLTGRNDGRAACRDLLQISGLRCGQLGGKLASDGRQVTHGLAEGIIQELVGRTIDGPERGAQRSLTADMAERHDGFEPYPRMAVGDGLGQARLCIGELGRPFADDAGGIGAHPEVSG